MPCLPCFSGVDPDAACRPREVPLAGLGGAFPRGVAFPRNRIRTSKYTPLTFLPLNLMEQLRKAANVYFLLMSVAMWLGQTTSLFISSIAAWTTFNTLALMMVVSAIIAALDDLRRHQADARTDAQTARVVRRGADGAFVVTICWAEVMVGDVVVLKGEEGLPADVVILATSGEKGGCYVSTANLDGETNLKVKSAAPLSQAGICGDEPMLNRAISRLPDLRGFVQAEAPQRSIHCFAGSLTLSGQEEPLCARHVLLRGTQLRNTAWCLGLVIYTGPETRMAMNSRSVPMKLANLERVVNKAMLVVLAAQAALALLSDLMYCISRSRFEQIWYLFPNGKSTTISLPVPVGFWITFFILYSNLMPISLYASMEICNFFQAYFIKNDLEMYDEDQDCPASVRSTNLCHELGQVSYVFSDKTGTLTQNVMELKRVSIGGKVYGTVGPERGFQGGPEMAAARRESERAALEIDAFLEVLAVSHTVIVAQRNEAGPKYEAESPDEGALVEAARELGWAFQGRLGQELEVEVRKRTGPEVLKYEVLALNAFTSDRRRMSVLARTPSGKYVLLIKGADSALLERANCPSPHLEAHLGDFAREGLRTLVVGRRRLTEAEALAWLANYERAELQLEGREQALAQVAEEIEADIEVLGATAIEDKLQVGVPDTVQRLRAAGIRLWVLTGDKTETAVNIGFSAGILSDEMEVITVGEGLSQDVELREQILGLGQRVEAAASDGGAALVLSGRYLEEACSLGVEKQLMEAASHCAVVIACRVSPLQKAHLVQWVRVSVKPTPVTLSVGDGANDVPMIQEAQVGVGIAGREGRQAVDAADFSIGQFRYLQRLLLVHGRWNYRRMCKFILYTFWKNAVLTLLLFHYTHFSGYSGTSLFESMVWTSFNVVLAWPVIFTGIFDRDVTATQALEHPWLYETGRSGLDLNVLRMVETLLSACVHSFIILAVMLLAFNGMDLSAVGDYYTFGTSVYSWLIIAMNYRVAFITTTWNWISVAGIVSSFLMYIVFLAIYCIWEWFDPQMYMVAYQMAKQLLFWIGCLAVPAIAMTVDVFKAYLVREFLPDRTDLILEQAKAGHLAREDRETAEGSARRPRSPFSRRSRSRKPSASTRSSFSFDHPRDMPRHHRSLAGPAPASGDTSLLDTAPRSSIAGRSMVELGSSFEFELPGDSSIMPEVVPPKRWRPSGSRFSQQALPSWQFVLFWRNVLAAALIVGTTLIFLACVAQLLSSGVVEMKIQYDGNRVNSSMWMDNDEIQHHPCPIPARGGSHVCSFNLTVTQDLEAPVYVLYAVSPLYQNYRAYLASVVPDELQGRFGTQSQRERACPEATRVDSQGRQIYPCGLEATSLFNDTFSFPGFKVSTKDIAWPSDVERVRNPDDYPTRENTSWLYMRYPTVVKEEEGVDNEHFLVWMRPQALPEARKPYGKLNITLRKGQTLMVNITASFPIPSDANKQLILMTRPSVLGGRNEGLVVCLAGSGMLCYTLGAFVIAIQLLCPREPGKPRGVLGRQARDQAGGSHAVTLALATISSRSSPGP